MLLLTYLLRAFYCISHGLLIAKLNAFPTDIYLLKINNRNTRTRCEICLKLTIKTPERRKWRRSHVSIVNFEHILHLVLIVSIVNF